MSLGEGTIERAVVFEHATDYRKVCAQRCLIAWTALFDTALAEVDLALRAEGPQLFAVARFRAGEFSDEIASRFTILAQHAGGTEVPVSELSIHERANFLTKLEQCAHQQKAVAPADAVQMFDQLFSQIGATEEDRRAAVRYPIEAPAIITTQNAEAAPASVENLSMGGAFVRTEHPAPLEATLSLEITLPTGVVHAEGKVVNVSATGMGIQFAPNPEVARDLAVKLETIAPAAPPPPSPVSLDALIEPAAAPVSATPAVRVGDYELLSLLGRGGMGEVHFARAVAGPRAEGVFAIKLLNARMAAKSEAVKLFASEAETLALLDHPDIVKTYEAGVFDGRHCLVMELVDGRDLGQILRRCKSRRIFLPIDFACFLVKTLLDALEAVHHAHNKAGEALNLVHCDISPHNLFISRVGEIKLGDFGLARRVSDTIVDAAAQGRPSYLSPEALDGQVSVHSDLWAAAVTAYELLTLETPFKGESLDELTRAIRKTGAMPVGHLRKEASPALEAVLQKALEKKPKNRYQSAAELSAALAPHFDPEVGTPLAIAAVVRGLFPDRKR